MAGKRCFPSSPTTVLPVYSLTHEPISCEVEMLECLHSGQLRRDGTCPHASHAAVRLRAVTERTRHHVPQIISCDTHLGSHARHLSVSRIPNHEPRSCPHSYARYRVIAASCPPFATTTLRCTRIPPGVVGYNFASLRLSYSGDNFSSCGLQPFIRLGVRLGLKYSRKHLRFCPMIVSNESSMR